MKSIKITGHDSGITLGMALSVNLPIYFDPDKNIIIGLQLLDGWIIVKLFIDMYFTYRIDSNNLGHPLTFPFTITWHYSPISYIMTKYLQN